MLKQLEVQHDKEEFEELLFRREDPHRIKILYFKYKFKVDQLRLYNNLRYILATQKENELLLEEVLNSIKIIDGLIEDKIRSFIYYNTPI
jgi:hypothetical protein